MTILILWLALGLVFLAVGGDFLVRGAVSLALRLGMSAAVAGLTIVAMGTSAPELVVSVMATLRGSNDIAVGNVVGSNIFNICVVLGLCAAIWPLKVTGSTVRVEWPFLFASTWVACLLFRDGSIDAVEGVFFLVSLVSFLAFSIRLARKDVLQGEIKAIEEEVREKNAPNRSIWIQIGFIVGGSLCLVLGARWMLKAAIEIATIMGLSERVIGLTIVGAGTGLPELAASIMASLRRHHDVAIGNIIGSNAYNILWILGASSLIQPLQVERALIEFDNWWMLGVTFLLFPIMRRGLSINRWEGGLLVALYISYLWFLF